MFSPSLSQSNHRTSQSLCLACCFRLTLRSSLSCMSFMLSLQSGDWSVVMPCRMHAVLHQQSSKDRVQAAHLRHKLDNWSCVKVHRCTAVPFLVTVWKIKRLQVSSHRGKDHFALLAIDAIVKSIILYTPAASDSSGTRLLARLHSFVRCIRFTLR